jgi:hypothetical protein
MTPTRDYTFTLPKGYGHLPQGMVWEKFLDLVGELMGYERRKVSFAGSSLSSDGVEIIGGGGGVGNKGYTYSIERKAPNIDDRRLDCAIKGAIEKLKRKKPGLLEILLGPIFYQ